MTELELRQMFKNLSDCYAYTWIDIGTDMIQGEVIQAMTEDRFIEALKQAKLLPIPHVSVAKRKVCAKCGNKDFFGDADTGKYYCDVCGTAQT